MMPHNSGVIGKLGWSLVCSCVGDIASGGCEGDPERLVTSRTMTFTQLHLYLYLYLHTYIYILYIYLYKYYMLQFLDKYILMALTLAILTLLLGP